MIRKKNLDPAIKARKVRVEYTISPDRSDFSIEDEGDGFDWRARLAKKADEPGLHGMGISMARHYVQDLSYNERGNKVGFGVEHRRATTNTMPRIFSQAQEIQVRDGEYILQEGEESDFLYYIVSGRFYVYSRGKLISSLSPDDIFLGEMSFLLSNRRSATVVARGPASLVKISKQDFVNMIKENPHYGIFLARLLAQRLAKLNARTARLNAEYLKLKAEKSAPAP
ncbi:MAG TPA: cyclic nucleotide-binding domain-containing protein [Rectinemataceae bacterium]|nr:cyclic nucleotide-binding domain-containing protein [Rectinemataceae bacterium]